MDPNVYSWCMAIAYKCCLQIYHILHIIITLTQKLTTQMGQLIEKKGAYASNTIFLDNYVNVQSIENC